MVHIHHMKTHICIISFTQTHIWFTHMHTQETWNTQENMHHNVSRAPHTFPLCLTCWWESEPLGRVDGAHFSLFLWSCVCDWGFIFAVLWREVTVCLNLKHLKYPRPPHPCSTLNEWPIHLDLSECVMVLRSCLPTLLVKLGHTDTLALDLIM